MPLKNSGSQIAFTSVASNTYATIIVGYVEAGLIRKHYISPLSMPVAVFTCPLQSEVLVVSGEWKPMQWHASHKSSPQKMATNCWSRQVQTRCSTPTSTQHCGWSYTVHHGHADKMAVIPCCGHITWSSTCSSLQMIIFSPLFPYMHNCRSSMPCMSCNVTVWQTCFPETNHSVPFECTHLLILCPFTSTRRTCTSFHVSTLFGSSALTEQDITLTLLVTKQMSLLGLCVCHLSGNVID